MFESLAGTRLHILVNTQALGADSAGQPQSSTGRDARYEPERTV